MAKRFFYVCAGLLCMAIAFQMGAKSAGAQAPRSDIGRYQLFQASYVVVDAKDNRADKEQAVMRIDTVTGAVKKYTTGLTADGTIFDMWDSTERTIPASGH